ncbi:hypothetical protein BGX31_004192, partial [Mortierella sp. GBA43]
FEVMISMEFSDNSHAQEGMQTRLKYTDDDKRMCRQIFERLGQLSQLAVLDMRLQQQRMTRRFGIKTSSPPLTLRMGLGYLSTLRNLKMIGYHGSQRIRLDDLEWMLEHWNKLRKILGDPDPIVVKRSRMLRGGAPDERLSLVKKALKARHVQVFIAKRSTTSEGLEALHDCESESEDGDEMQVVQ